MSPSPIFYGMDRGQLGQLAAMVAAAFGYGTMLSMAMPLMSLVLEARGISSAWIGANAAISGLAAFIMTPFLAGLVRRLGATGVMLAGLAGAAAIFPVFYFLDAFWAWFPVRLAFSCAITNIFVITEFWITALVPAERRGLVLGIYSCFLAGGFAVGPALLALTGAEGLMPFLAASAIMVAACLPVLMVRGSEPVVEEAPQKSVIGFITSLPIATVAAAVFGLVEIGTMAIVPLYGLKLGYSVADSALIVAAAAAGNIVFQVPIGLIADRMDKVRLMLIMAAIGLAGALAVPLVAHHYGLLIVVVFLWGGTIAGLYTAGIIHLGARYSGADLVTANATFGLMYSVGMLTGPPLIGLGLDILPPHGAMWVMAAVFALYLLAALFPAFRLGTDAR